MQDAATRCLLDDDEQMGIVHKCSARRMACIENSGLEKGEKGQCCQTTIEVEGTIAQVSSCEEATKTVLLGGGFNGDIVFIDPCACSSQPGVEHNW